MRKTILALLSMTILFGSCAKLNDPRSNMKRTTVGFGKCARATLMNEDVEICLEEIIEDSRCPANAMCTWSGIARARFTFKEHGVSHTLVLASWDMGAGYRKDTTIGAYRIELMNLDPYPGTQPAPVPDADKEAEVLISKM